jgi:outer membrane protein TolC
MALVQVHPRCCLWLLVFFVSNPITTSTFAKACDLFKRWKCMRFFCTSIHVFCHQYPLYVLIVFCQLAVGRDSTQCRVLSFPQICNKAIDHSALLNASRSQLKAARASYFGSFPDFIPDIGIRVAAEYTKNRAPHNEGLQAFGSDLFKDADGYSSSLYVTSSYVITSLPVACSNTRILQAETKIKALDTTLARRELALDILGSYADALIKSKQYEQLHQIFQYSQQLEQLYTRLTNTGKLSKPELIAQTIETAKVNARLETAQWAYQRALAKLSEKTGESYVYNACSLQDFDVTLESIDTTSCSAAEVQRLDAQIEQKISAHHRAYWQLLPQLELNARYALLKEDSAQLISTLRHLTPQNWRIGASLSWSLNSLARSSAESVRAKAALDEVVATRQQFLLDCNGRLQQLALTMKAAGADRDNNERIQAQCQSSDSLAQRLRSAQIIGEAEALQMKIKWLEQRSIVHEKVVMQGYAALQYAILQGNASVLSH